MLYEQLTLSDVVSLPDKQMEVAETIAYLRVRLSFRRDRYRLLVCNNRPFLAKKCPDLVPLVTS